MLRSFHQLICLTISEVETAEDDEYEDHEIRVLNEVDEMKAAIYQMSLTSG